VADANTMGEEGDRATPGMPASRPRCDAVWLAGYFSGVVLIAILISPVVFQAGKALAEVSLGRPTNPPLEWLARRADVMDFGMCFVATLASVALALLPLLVRGMGARLLPERSWFSTGKRSVAVRAGALGGCAALLAGLVAGWLAGGDGKSIAFTLRALAAAVVAAAAYEWMFRGVWLRVFSPGLAVGTSVLAFAVARVMLTPPDFSYADEESWTLGFQMVRMMSGSGDFWIGAALPAVGWGLLLAWTRVRFASLWTPLMLHAGWLVAAGWCGAGQGWIAWAALGSAAAACFIFPKKGPHDEHD